MREGTRPEGKRGGTNEGKRVGSNILVSLFWEPFERLLDKAEHEAIEGIERRSFRSTICGNPFGQSSRPERAHSTPKIGGRINLQMCNIVLADLCLIRINF